MKRLTIIGAGFAGLTLARALALRGVPVRVIEAASRPGGMIATEETPSGLVESAAPSLNRTARVEKLLGDLNLVLLEPAPAAKKRLFYVGGKFRAWPLGLFASIDFALRVLWSKISGALPPREQETLHAWATRCLGRQAADNLVATAMQGVYAGDARKLSASLLLGHLFRSGREKFKGVVGVQGGMGALIVALEKSVRDLGGEIVCGEGASAADLPATCVIATSARAAADLLAVRAPDITANLRRVEILPLVTASLFFERPTGPHAFGGLVKRGEGVRALGVLLNHEIFPGRDRLFGETWIYGGATDPSMASKTPVEIFDVIRQERKILFAREDTPVEKRVTIWSEALPHYDLALEGVLKSLAEPSGIYLHGNWRGGIGLSRILERSDRMAERIAGEWS